MEAATVDVVVVFQRQEYYVSTQASSDRKTLAVELLQCQLLSLVGVIPDEQLLLSSSGEVLYGPSKPDVATLSVSTETRSRFFLFCSSGAPSQVPEMASDWRQICSKSTFGDAAVVQPAFRKVVPGGGDPLATLICEPCARTCTTGFQPVSPMEWSASKAVASRFISDVTVIAGEVDIAAPPGFTKLPMDLNYSASGDYVYLCVKRGGPRALTQLHVLFEQRGGDCSTTVSKESSHAVEKVIGVECTGGGSIGDDTGMSVRVGYDSVQLKGNIDQLEALAITDIAVAVGDQPPPTSGYIKIPRSLNEGVPGAEPVFLYYRLSALGGFVCDSSREHSEFGECLFAARHLVGVKSLLDLDERRLAVAQAALSAERRRGDAAVMETHYRQHQPGMLQRLQSGLQRAQSYEKKQMQEEALKRIPVDKLHERARANPSPMPLYQDELVKQLLHWFKREFFTWMNQPRCSACNHDKTRSVRTEGPSTAEEIAGQASRVEVYQCPACGAFTRFPRYNDPVKLLDTRTGRCGEWANCFTLCCRAMGFEARYVLDVTDHVWTEVYSEHFKRWLHCDSCEDQLDCPLTYEVGWGKKLSYIFSFAHDEVVDTARRYTQNWPEMRARRQEVSEQWLETTISQINHGQWQRQTPERVAILTARAQTEREELRRGRSVQKAEVKGRVSGSAEWKSQREEDGKQEETPVSAAGTQNAATTTASVASSEILQAICKNLVVGCQSADCNNPFCLTGRVGSSFPEASSDVNERAAQAIQVVTALNSLGFPSESLAMLQCSTEPTEVRSFLWKYHPWVYLPLQDPPSRDGTELLIDISGHGNHAENTQQCALRKPFRIPNSGRPVSFGMQLLGHKYLSIPIKTGLSTGGYLVSFLVRFDQDGAFEAKEDGVVAILSGRLGATPSAFCISWNCTDKCFSWELQGESKSAGRASPSLAFGQYAHVAVLQGDGSISMYVNGTRLGHVEVAMIEAKSPAVVTVEGPKERYASISAVISQVAVMPLASQKEAEEFCAAMKTSFVSAPPLRAFGPNGERSGERCSDAAAQAQSGYRVARVLLWGGEFFDGLQFIYEKSSPPGNSSNSSLSTVQGTLVGNPNAKRQASQPTSTLELLSDEVITRVGGRKGAWTDSITLETNFGRSVTCGGRGGGDFTVPTPAGSEIRAITFKTSDHLTDISAFVLESAPTKSLEDQTMKALQLALSTSESKLRQNAVSAALRYLDNISRQPEEMKFQRIRASNKYFASNVGVLGGQAATSLMGWCGFEERTEQDGQFFVFKPSPSPQRVAAEAHKRIHFLKNVGTQ